MKKTISLFVLLWMLSFQLQAQCNYNCTNASSCNLICNSEFVSNVSPPSSCNNNTVTLLPQGFPGWSSLARPSSAGYFPCPNGTGHDENIGGFVKLGTFNFDGTTDIFSGAIQTPVSLIPGRRYIFSYQSKTSPAYTPPPNPNGPSTITIDLENWNVFLMKSPTLPNGVEVCEYEFTDNTGSTDVDIYSEPLQAFISNSVKVGEYYYSDFFEILHLEDLSQPTWEQTIVCFTAPADADQYDKLFLLPRRDPVTDSSAKFRSDIFIDNIELIEDNLSAGNDLSICEGTDVTIGDPSCTVSGADLEWYLDDGTGQPDYNAGELGTNEDGTLTIENAVAGVYTYHLVRNIDSGVNVIDNCNGQMILSDQVVLTVEQDDISLRVLLEGPLDEDNIGFMKTKLYELEVLPGMIENSVAGQPYNVPPYNYQGTEGINFTDADYEETTVDWVLVSLRTSLGVNYTAYQRAGLLEEEGDVEFVDPCPFGNVPDGNYYVHIAHRNHLDIISKKAVSVVNGNFDYDFTNKDSYDGNGLGSGQKLLPTGDWVMYAGDMNQDEDFGFSDINGLDKIAWSLANGSFQVYLPEDANLDGDVNGADKIVWSFNNGISNRVHK